MTFRMLATALAVGATLALAGCVPDGTVVVPVETGVVKPIFASDEEALAAAVERYGDYIASADMVTANGGKTPEQVQPFVTTERYEKERESFLKWVEAELVSKGSTRFERVTFQQYGANSAPEFVTFYVCIDVTDVRVLNASGVDVTPLSRINRAALEIEVEILGPRQSDLRIARSEEWQDQQVC